MGCRPYGDRPFSEPCQVLKILTGQFCLMAVERSVVAHREVDVQDVVMFNYRNAIDNGGLVTGPTKEVERTFHELMTTA